jgi:hypothetical protein
MIGLRQNGLKKLKVSPIGSPRTATSSPSGRQNKQGDVLIAGRLPGSGRAPTNRGTQTTTPASGVRLTSNTGSG